MDLLERDPPPDSSREAKPCPGVLTTVLVRSAHGYIRRNQARQRLIWRQQATGQEGTLGKVLKCENWRDCPPCCSDRLEPGSSRQMGGVKRAIPER